MQDNNAFGRAMPLPARWIGKRLNDEGMLRVLENMEEKYPDTEIKVNFSDGSQPAYYNTPKSR